MIISIMYKDEWYYTGIGHCYFKGIHPDPSNVRPDPQPYFLATTRKGGKWSLHLPRLFAQLSYTSSYIFYSMWLREAAKHGIFWVGVRAWLLRKKSFFEALKKILKKFVATQLEVGGW